MQAVSFAELVKLMKLIESREQLTDTADKNAHGTNCKLFFLVKLSLACDKASMHKITRPQKVNITATNTENNEIWLWLANLTPPN